MKKALALVLLGIGSLFAEAALAVDCSGLDSWDFQIAYTGGAMVQHNGAAYQANWWTQNQNPETHSGQWQEWTQLGPCDGNPPPGNQPPTAQANGPYNATAGSAIAFSSSGSFDPDGTIAAYLWSFGDGATSNSANPSHTYPNAGTFTATLTVTDDDGSAGTDSAAATVTDEGGPPGGSCDGLPRYVAGTTYATGDSVFNIRLADNQAVRYRCVIAGWCSSSAAWAYEPGNGMHWEDAWLEESLCTGGAQDPIAVTNGPYSGQIGAAIAFSSVGSSDPDGTIVAYSWNFGDGTVSVNANPSHSYAAPGTFTVTLTVTDNDGRTALASTVASVGGGGGGPLPRRLLVGYWHNFTNQAGYLPVAQVSGDWDIVNIAFAENDPFGQPGEVAFGPAEESDASFRASVQQLQAGGQKVLISLGGANAHIQLNSVAERDNFIRTMEDIIASYGFDGMDIDLEGGSLNMNAGDTVANPQTPAIVNLIEATRALKARFGPGFLLTMAPETAHVQGGFAVFGGIWGSYLPLIHALRNDLTVLHVQHYNTGSITGADDVTYLPATSDFHVALSDMMITGFPAGRDPGNFFPGLRADQVAFGLPASAGAAGSGQTSVAATQQALDCLIKRTRCGSYVPAQARADFRGLMTWSITWDSASGFGFSGPHRTYLDQNP